MPETTQGGLARVPTVTVYFWVIKILTTAMGEATSDYLVHGFNPYLAVVGGFVAFVIAMAIQFSMRQLRPVGVLARGRRWSRCSGRWRPTSCTSSSGSRTSPRRSLFAIAPGRRVHRLVPKRRHALDPQHQHAHGARSFYWAAVLATFAMGTAAGDLAAYTANLGFLTAGARVRRGLRDPGARLPLPQPERDLRVLVRLRLDAAARRLVRRLDWESRAPRAASATATAPSPSSSRSASSRSSATSR